jgi:aldehyde oxidoreductase
MTAAAQVAGASVITIEGLAEQTRCGAALQRAFLTYGAAQCGACTPGMLVSAAALLETRPKPTDEEIEEALSGVLCRCTGYRQIIAAVRAVAAGHTFAAITPPA